MAPIIELKKKQIKKKWFFMVTGLYINSYHPPILLKSNDGIMKEGHSLSSTWEMLSLRNVSKHNFLVYYVQYSPLFD